MQQIAEAAATSRATVFGRCGSKLGVLEALGVRGASGPEMSAIRDAFAVEDPVAALDAGAAASCVLWERQGSSLRTLKAISVLEPDAGRLLDEQRADQHGSLQRLVRRLGKAGTLRPGAVRAADARHPARRDERRHVRRAAPPALDTRPSL